MKRTDSHILEDESRRKFEEALPRNWVTRKQDPDYGYDYDVQIFDNEIPTPFHFYVQLKATEVEKISKKGTPLSFETKYFKLYAQGPFPVMICLYIKSIDKLFYVWVDDYLNKLDLKSYKDINIQKYKTIYLKKELINKKHGQLEMEVRRLNYVRNPNFLADDTFDIHLYITPKPTKNKELFKKIFLYFYGKYNIRFFRLLQSENIEKANLILNLKKQVSKIKYDGESLDIPIKLGDEKIFPSLAISLGVLLLQSGYSNNAADLILKSLSNEITVLDENYIFTTSAFISNILHKGNKSMYILELSNCLKQSGKINAAGWLANSGNFIVSLDESVDKLYKSKYVEFNESLLLLYKSDTEKSIGYYNMANVLSRSLDEFRKAIRYYFNARRYAPEYEKRSYWWAELGGCFFHINKFKLSEDFYRRSVELGEETIPAQALKADAILYQGRYSEAAKEFESYLEDKDYREYEFILKYLISIFLSRYFKDKPRKIKEAEQITDDAIKNFIKTGNKKETIRRLREAIDLDPLCGSAWYNYAVSVCNDKKEERFLEWVITSILQPWNLESWTNALCLMIFDNIMVEDTTLFCSFASQAVDNFGNSLFISVENFFKEQRSLPDKLISEKIDFLKQSLTKISIIYKKEKPLFTLRMLKDD